MIAKGPIASTSIASLKNAGVTFAAGVLGVMTLTGLAPDISQGNSIAADLGTVTLTQLVPTLGNTANQGITAPLGTITLTGLTTAATQGNSQTAPLGTVTLTQLVPTLTQGNSQTAPLGTVTLTQLVPVFNQSEGEVAPLGTITLTGLVPTFDQTGTTTTGGGVGGGKGKKGRGTRTQYVEIDGELYPVRDEAHAQEILAQLYELAQENAQKLAKQAKPLRTRKNAQIVPLITDPPALATDLPDLQPTLDAMSAQIKALYEEALRGEAALRAYEAKRAEQDDEDAIALLLG